MMTQFTDTYAAPGGDIEESLQMLFHNCYFLPGAPFTNME